MPTSLICYRSSITLSFRVARSPQKTLFLPFPLGRVSCRVLAEIVGRDGHSWELVGCDVLVDGKLLGNTAVGTTVSG